MCEQESDSKLVEPVVFDILNNSKASFPLRNEELRKIEMEIEDLTLFFDEESIFKIAPELINLFREKNESARDYLMNMELSKDDIELLSEFGEYTIEALIVHVLGVVFNPLRENKLIINSSFFFGFSIRKVCP